MYRLQATLELLITYSFVLLIITLALAFIYIYYTGFSFSNYYSCSFNSNFNCIYAVLDPYRINQSVLLVELQYNNIGDAHISSFVASIFNRNFTGSCLPDNLSSGSIAFCYANITGVVTPTARYNIYTSVASTLCGVSCSPIRSTGSIYVEASNYISSQPLICILNISIDNNQGSSMPYGFQEEISIDPQNYKECESSNLGNLRFYYNGDILHSWCFSNCSDNSSIARFFVKLPFSLSSGDSKTISILFLPRSVNYDKVFAGENPYLSKVYGIYDNGQYVFNMYFNGSSILPTYYIPSNGNITIVSNAPTPYNHSILLESGPSGGPTSWLSTWDSGVNLGASYIMQALVYQKGAGSASLLTNIQSNIGNYYIFSSGFSNLHSISYYNGSINQICNGASIPHNRWVQITAFRYYDNFSLYYSNSFNLSNFGDLICSGSSSSMDNIGGFGIANAGPGKSYYAIILVREAMSNGGMPSYSTEGFYVITT